MEYVHYNEITLLKKCACSRNEIDICTVASFKLGRSPLIWKFQIMYLDTKHIYSHFICKHMSENKQKTEDKYLKLITILN